MPKFDPNIAPPTLSNTVPMADDTSVGVTSHAAYSADLLTRRKAWVSGLLKNDSFVYYSKATTVSGVVTFYITDDGTSAGNAVFSNVYADAVSITPYGNAAVYEVYGVTVATNKKSITANVDQITSVLLGLIQNTTASNGVQCNMLCLGD